MQRAAERHLAETPTDAPPGPSFKDCEHCPEMVALPIGAFLMGSPETEIGREGIEGPQRHVVLAQRFAIGRFQVTVNQFAAFVAETEFQASTLCRAYVMGAQPPEWPLIKATFLDPGFRVTGLHPAVCVNWRDATAYVAWLARKTGKPYRLPSEAESAAWGGEPAVFSSSVKPMVR